MKKILVITTVTIISFLLIVYFFLCRFCFTPPQYDEHKIIIDVWNQTNKKISGMTLMCDDPITEIVIPDMDSRERVVYVMNPLDVSSGFAVMNMVYDNNDYELFGELIRLNGGEARVIIKEEEIIIYDISYTLNRYDDMFYYKPYKLVYLN